MHSKAKGSIGELKVASDLLKRDFRVFKELGDLSKIDLIAEKDHKLIKFQVKAFNSKNGSIHLDSRKAGPNYSFRYTKDDADIFAVYVLDRDFILYVSAAQLLDENRTTLTIRIDKAKNNQKSLCNFVEDFTLERALRDYTQDIQTDHAVDNEIVQTTTEMAIEK